MTNGSEPRRRRWSSDSSRKAADARRAAEEDDAESLLSAFRPAPSEPNAFRPDPSDRDAGGSGGFPAPPAAFGARPEDPFGSRPEDDVSPFDEAPRRRERTESVEEAPRRRGRREPVEDAAPRRGWRRTPDAERPAEPVEDAAPRRGWRRTPDTERPAEPAPERREPPPVTPPQAESPRRSRRADPAVAGPPSWPPVTPVNPPAGVRQERPTGSIPAERTGGVVPPDRGGSRDEPGTGRFRTAPEPPSRGFPAPEQAPPAPTGRVRATGQVRRRDDGPVSGSFQPPAPAPSEPPVYGRRAAPEPPADRRPEPEVPPGRRTAPEPDGWAAPESPTGRRAAPEPPTGRRAAPEPPTGRRAASEANGWGSGPAVYGSPPPGYGQAAEQPWTSPVDTGRHTRGSRGPATDAGPPTVDPVRAAGVSGRHERPADPGIERGRHNAPPDGTQEHVGRSRPDGYGDRPPAYPPDDDRGRRRAPAPDEQPTGGRRSPDFQARASVSVPVAPTTSFPPPGAQPWGPAGTPAPPHAAQPAPPRAVARPPMPAAPESPESVVPQSATRTWQPSSVTVDPTQAPPGRASASARVAPAGAARVPAGTAWMPAAAPPGVDRRDGHRPEVDDLWSPPEIPRRDSRRGTEDSGRIRRRAEESGSIRRPAEESGSVRRRSREDRRAAEDTGRRLPATWMPTALIVVGVIVLALIVAGGYMLINSGQPGSSSKQSANGAGAGKARDISSRDVDRADLTAQEVFPGQQISVNDAKYQVLKTEATDCQSAATDDIAKLLGGLDCTQVVRGTLKSPDGQFLITAGIFNLKDEASANKAYESIKPTLDAQKGRFTGLAAGDGTEAIVRAPTTLGWHPLGHFLAYAIVARADGKPISADDAASKNVISDIVEGHLRDGIIGARAAATPPAK